MTFEPGTRVLFMKVGTHAGEDLAAIIERKQQEIDAEGFSLWGYGGNTCHPTSMVQPFARAADGPIVLAMHSMVSNHFAAPVRADEYSADGVSWQRIPDAINVLGSRYALAVTNLQPVADALNLGATRVAVGNSRGKVGSDYVRGRVDKACLEVAPPAEMNVAPLQISLRAELVDPFAVFLRN